MKKYLVIVMVAVMAVVAHGQTLTQGTREFMISGDWDPEGSTGADLELEVGYGVFVRDGIEVGGLLSYSSTEALVGNDLTSLGLGGFVEYHFQLDAGGQTVPYVGAKLLYVDEEAFGLDETAFVYGPRIGIKHFITDNVAVDIGLEYMLASEDIFNNEGTLEDDDLSLSFGLRASF